LSIDYTKHINSQKRPLLISLQNANNNFSSLYNITNVMNQSIMHSIVLS